MKTKNAHTNVNLAYAVQLVHGTCCLAGSASYLDDVRTDLRRRGITRAIRDRDTPALFDWLVETLSFQGISDAVASGYMAQHGTVRWSEHCRCFCRKDHRARSSVDTGGFRLPIPQGVRTRVLSRTTLTPAPSPAKHCATAA